jgi:hypothetical protein
MDINLMTAFVIATYWEKHGRQLKQKRAKNDSDIFTRVWTVPEERRDKDYAKRS